MTTQIQDDRMERLFLQYQQHGGEIKPDRKDVYEGRPVADRSRRWSLMIL